MTAKVRATPAKRTQQQRSGAAIDALLEVARDSFGSKGYDATSLDDVAARAGMTKGAVYHHFGSKHALFEGVFRLEHRRTIDTVVAKSRGARDPIDGLLRGVRAYLQYVLDPLAQRILLEDGPSVLGWERWRRCEEPGFQQLLERSLTLAAERAMLRPGVQPAETALLLLGALTEGALAVAHADDPTSTARRLSDALATHVGALARQSADPVRKGRGVVHQTAAPRGARRASGGPTSKHPSGASDGAPRATGSTARSEDRARPRQRRRRAAAAAPDAPA